MSAPAKLQSSRLSDIVGAAHIITDPADLSAFEIDGHHPSAAASPGSAEEIAELVKMAAAEKLAVIPAGSRTKLGIGMPPERYDLAVDLTRLDRIIAYDPGDLTLGVEAGVLLGKLMPLLAEHKQSLPLFVPYTFRATIGGTLASGVDSPLRQFYGTARDYVLGMEFITGEGVLTKSGGRVVKNVTGYDLHKLMLVALGTLGIITRINFKTFPRPQTSHGFLAFFNDSSGAVALRHRIAQSPLTPLTLEILSPRLASLFQNPLPAGLDAAGVDAAPPGPWFLTSHWILAAAYAGNDSVLERYAKDLTQFAADAGAINAIVLGDQDRPSVWGRLREAIPLMLQSSPAATISRLAVLPGQVEKILVQAQQVADRHAIPVAILARGMGAVYCAFLPHARDDGTIANLATACREIFQAASIAGGNAVIPWCPPELKTKVNVWGEPRGDFPLMQKLKNVFDPHRILSPGRFVGGL